MSCSTDGASCRAAWMARDAATKQWATERKAAYADATVKEALTPISRAAYVVGPLRGAPCCCHDIHIVRNHNSLRHQTFSFTTY